MSQKRARIWQDASLAALTFIATACGDSRPSPPAQPAPTRDGGGSAPRACSSAATTKFRAALDAKVTRGAASFDELKWLTRVCEAQNDLACQARVAELIKGGMGKAETTLSPSHFNDHPSPCCPPGDLLCAMKQSAGGLPCGPQPCLAPEKDVVVR